MQLCEASENKDYIIKEINGDTHFNERISSMGLREGVRLKVLRNKRKLPLLIYAQDTMIAIGRAESEKLLIGGADDDK